MKRKLIYYSSILLVAVLIFIFNRSQSTQETPLDNLPNSEADPLDLPLREEASTSTPTTFNLKELEGSYWDHPYIKENPEVRDVAVDLRLNDKNELEAQFLFYEPIESDGEEWGVQRDGGITTLTPLSDSVLIVNHPIDPFIGDFLYIIKTADQIGLSLDGKTIAYYKNQRIMPDLSNQAFIKYFYGGESEAEGHRVKVGRIEQFTELDRTYALVFFEEYYNQAHGSRYGSNSALLSVAKFEKKQNGWHFKKFQVACDCGYYNHAFASDDVISYPTLQKIGHKHFLFKKTQDQNDDLNTTVLQIYEVDGFKEVLDVTLEKYQVNALGEKEYTIRHKINFPVDDEECAIIIKHAPLDGNSTPFILNQDIYLFDEESKVFEKAP